MMAMGYFASSTTTTTKRKIKKFAESDTEKWKSGRATFWRRRRWRKWKNPIFNELNFFGNTEAEWENIVKDRDARQKQKYRKNKKTKKFWFRRKWIQESLRFVLIEAWMGASNPGNWDWSKRSEFFDSSFPPSAVNLKSGCRQTILFVQQIFFENIFNEKGRLKHFFNLTHPPSCIQSSFTTNNDWEMDVSPPCPRWCKKRNTKIDT